MLAECSLNEWGDMIRLQQLILGFFLVSIAACGNPKQVTTETPTFGEQVGKNVYTIPAFGMTVEKPEDWYALDSAQAKLLVDQGKDVSAAGNKELQAVMEASQRNMSELFSFFRYAPGTPTHNNPSVLGVAESVAAAPGIKTGADYFFHAKRLMVQSNAHYEFADSYGERIIGGSKFDRMDVTISLAGVEAQQSYYAARRGDFIVSIIESYKTPEEHEATSAIIDSIKLN